MNNGSGDYLVFEASADSHGQLLAFSRDETDYWKKRGRSRWRRYASLGTWEEVAQAGNAEARAKK